MHNYLEELDELTMIPDALLDHTTYQGIKVIHILYLEHHNWSL
jgi:hypothetical protein